MDTFYFEKTTKGREKGEPIDAIKQGITRNYPVIFIQQKFRISSFCENRGRVRKEVTTPEILTILEFKRIL
jgi:hypothetical protein